MMVSAFIFLANIMASRAHTFVVTSHLYEIIWGGTAQVVGSYSAKKLKKPTNDLNSL